MKPVLSICIPTNGVAKWVFPVLDSIYADDIKYELFEVVVTDNGVDEDFRTQMLTYVEKFPNLIYERTNAFEFLNEIEAYKRANGELIKFINHRTKFISGTLEYLVNFAKNNIKEKPIIYFANGVLSMKDEISEYDSFDLFVRNLSYFSSWSTGMCFWKEDFDRIPEQKNYNVLFPHTTILFNEWNRSRYIIDNTVLLDEIPTGTTPKGRYNLFNAFAVEYPAIILDLVREGKICIDTFYSVLEDNLEFVASLYLEYILLRRECSYDLSKHKETIGVFYSKRNLYCSCFKEIIKRFIQKIKR